MTPTQQALAAYNASADDYRKQLLASGGIRAALARAAADADPLLGNLRTAKADVQKRLGTVFADSEDLSGITDPRLREALRERRSSEYGAENERLGGSISDLQGSKEQTVSKLGNVFDALTGAKQFDVTQKSGVLDRATAAESAAQNRAFESRFDDQTRRKLEAEIGAANRSNRGGGADGLTTLQALQNPLLAFQAAGGKRIQKADGGFDFFDPSGKPITVEQAAAMSGGTKTDFLAGSAAKQDTDFIQKLVAASNPPSPAAKQQQINQLSGKQSLATLESLLNSGISQKEMLTSKTGLSSLFASNRAKQYRDAARNIADIVARIRTGAQINEKEMDLYLQFVPGPSDSPDVRKQKLETLKTIFGGGAVPEAPGLPAASEEGIPGI